MEGHEGYQQNQVIRKIKATEKEGERMAQCLKSDSTLPPYMAYPKFLLKLNISETAKLVYMLLWTGRGCP